MLSWGDVDAGPLSCARVFVGEVNFAAVARSEGAVSSSHCVEHCPAKKSACRTMACSMAMFVFTPLMCVSSSARRALSTQLSHEDAVMMSLASRLSKSADTMLGRPLMRCVSTLMPFPVGNWKLVILPIERDQSLSTSSAVMRSWMECAVGGVKGLRGVFGRPQVSINSPWARRSWALTMSVMEMDSVIVCSTCSRGFTSRK